jgi:adenylate cyclase
MATTRQLAAIMFADIAGYTSLMETDESLAMDYRNKLKKRLDEIVNEYSVVMVHYAVFQVRWVV